MSREELLLLLVIALVFTPLEWLRPVRRTPTDWRRLRTDILHMFISSSLVRFGVGALMMLLMAAVQPILPADLRPAIRAQPGWLQFLEILLISDFAFYCAHRLVHAVPALWRFHEVHHSSEKLDWVAGHRLHPLDQTLQAAIISAPTFLLGFSPEPFLAWALFYRWQAEFTHANISVNLGPLRWLIAGPQYHHWHHADEAHAYDKNFGGQLLIFDWLFGTLHLPKPGEMPSKYGISEPIARDYLGQLAHPFRRRDPSAAQAPALTDELSQA